MLVAVVMLCAPDYKFGRAAQNVVILMIGTPGPWSIFATRPPPLLAVDKLQCYPRCVLIASAVADFSHN